MSDAGEIRRRKIIGFGSRRLGQMRRQKIIAFGRCRRTALVDKSAESDYFQRQL